MITTILNVLEDRRQYTSAALMPPPWSTRERRERCSYETKTSGGVFQPCWKVDSLLAHQDHNNTHTHTHRYEYLNCNQQ